MEKHEARKHMLKTLKKMMVDGDDMGLPTALKGKSPSTQQVSVMADNPEDLEDGLSQAQQILQKRKALLGIPDDQDEQDESSEEDPEDEEDDAISMLQDAQAKEKAAPDEDDESEEEETQEPGTKSCIDILKDMLDDVSIKHLRPLQAYMDMCSPADQQEIRDYYTKVSRLHV